MTKYWVSNWEDLSGDTPEFVALRNEALRQLSGVPEPHRPVWERRLKSKEEHAHSSARLEIFLHDFFKKRGWDIEIEPELPATRNKPDFLLTSGDRSLIVEAKAVLGAESERQQDHRLTQLVRDLSGKLNRTVLIHPMCDLPSSLPNRHIAREIESRATEVGLLQEFLVEGAHQEQRYSLEVTVLLEAKPTPSADVGATVSQVTEVDIAHAVRKAIMGKAHKYGEMLTPYVVAVWPKYAVWPKLPEPLSFGSDDDLVALDGDKEMVLLDYADGTSKLQSSTKPNGVFTTKKDDGTHRYSDVSAVLFCHPYNTDSSRMYIHHNPFAQRPIGVEVFKGIPQCTVDLATGRPQ